MKKQIEQEELLADVLADNEECRVTTLKRGLLVLRRVRARRRVTRLVLVSLPIVLAMMLLVQGRRAATTMPSGRAADSLTAAAAHATKTIEGTPIRVLTDEELFAFFKGRPVALIGQPGHQKLVLLDETVQ